MAFDTLQFANRLKAAGVPSAHAEAEACALAEVLAGQGERLATKQDVDALGQRIDLLETQIEERLATKQDVDALGHRIDLLEAQIELRATKADLAALEAEMGRVEERLEAEMGRIEERLETKIEKSALRLHGEIMALGHQMGLMRWMMGLMVAGLTSLIAKAFLPGL